MANRVTQQDVKNINELYLKLKTYAAVARETGFSPSTIKKYVIPNYHHVQSNEIIKFNGIIPNIDFSLFESDDWGDICLLSDSEKEEIKNLWKEISI